jgi:hypothetical protein
MLTNALVDTTSDSTSDSGGFSRGFGVGGCSGHAPVASALAGGGCWRLKWRRDGALLVAAMHGGATVLHFRSHGKGEPAWRLAAAARYTGHGSLAYGADWCAAPAKADPAGLAKADPAARKGNAAPRRVASSGSAVSAASSSDAGSGLGLCVTCSFYDHALHLWRCPI